MDSTVKLVLGSVAFAVFWVLAVFPTIPCLPIGRTAGSILGAVLMVIFQVVGPSEAYSAIDLSILGLLFGTMVVSVYLERADAYKHLGKLLSWKSQGPKDLILRVCLVSAIASAFFTNDTSCIVLTEFVLKVARQHNLPPHPFLVALASSANIGSSATPIGNPQNLVIATEGGISFWNFLIGIVPAATIGTLLNAALLLCMYWKDLSFHKDRWNEESESVSEDEITHHKFSPATMSHGASSSFQERSIGSMDLQNPLLYSKGSMACSNCGNCRRRFSASEGDLLRNPIVVLENSPGTLNTSEKWKEALTKSFVYLVSIGMFIALIMGMNMSWTAITAALALVVLDFKDAQPCLEKVSYSLLIFFSGMFVTMDGFNKNGIPSSLWELMEPYAQIDRASGIAILALVILVLSNMISNVPTVLLLGSRMAASAAAISSVYEMKSWLILAWVSTVAGNLSLVGSAANMIVCEQACRAPQIGYNLTFWSHLKFGFPSTIIVTALGLLLVVRY